jgi:crossover junction endodeoxyribonuclease RuvC
VGITARQFATLQKRTASGSRRRAAAAAEPACGVVRGGPDARTVSTVILGVDPSLRGTGYGVVHWTGSQPAVLTHGTIKSPPAWERSRCLAHIARSLREVVARHQPTVCVIEGLFFAQNLKTALTMGEARGAALAVVAEAGMEIYEMAPRRMKQAIVGYGAASKNAVGRMVQRMLRLVEMPGPDAADALALALAHGQQNRRLALAAAKRI